MIYYYYQTTIVLDDNRKQGKKMTNEHIIGTKEQWAPQRKNQADVLRDIHNHLITKKSAENGYIREGAGYSAGVVTGSLIGCFLLIILAIFF